ncbi:hypothetical protein FIBSPDRAFT_992613 [Athelia psychrophila]|uniref:Uncharacterized protein n=1 Tax=Athelia psychrophila TaxID=1759441 RepID=A0A165YNI3_9AGAM|nr:hypothetical protein FIBSPDRAFT_992613 [Fibularhizoctonia sp. CBS 109695]
MSLTLHASPTPSQGPGCSVMALGPSSLFSSSSSPLFAACPHVHAPSDARPAAPRARPPSSRVRPPGPRVRLRQRHTHIRELRVHARQHHVHVRQHHTHVRQPHAHVRQLHAHVRQLHAHTRQLHAHVRQPHPRTRLSSRACSPALTRIALARPGPTRTLAASRVRPPASANPTHWPALSPYASPTRMFPRPAHSPRSLAGPRASSAHACAQHPRTQLPAPTAKPVTSPPARSPTRPCSYASPTRTSGMFPAPRSFRKLVRRPARRLCPRGIPDSLALPDCFVWARGHAGGRVRLVYVAGDASVPPVPAQLRAVWFRFLAGQLRAVQLLLFASEAETPTL